jgi:hypothetical protein
MTQNITATGPSAISASSAVQDGGARVTGGEGKRGFPVRLVFA